MQSVIRESGICASLPWYDLREIRRATDTLWHAMAGQLRQAGLVNVPRRLNRRVAYERQWSSAEFLFGQACGYDVRIAFAGQLQVIATPCYAAPGCDRGTYCSFIVVRENARFRDVEDLRGTRCVVNSPTSHSGMNVLRALVAPLHRDGRFFSQVQVSGSHERSLRMIRRDKVDVAAIDCVTYALLERNRPAELAGTRVLHRTEQVPAPPYVTGSATTPDTLVALREALQRTLADPAIESAKEQLLLCGVDLLPHEAYQSIEALESVAHRHNYREMPSRVLLTR